MRGHEERLAAEARLPEGARLGPLLAAVRLEALGARSDERAGLLPVLRDAAAGSLAADAALGRVLVGLAAAGVPVLVLKGAAFAHTCYPAPHLRPRRDDDLLVPRDRFDEAIGVLEDLGYRAGIQAGGDLWVGQRHFAGRAASGPVHHVDLHWRPLNPAAFEGFPTFAALLASSVPLPGVGAAARAPGPVHALLLACAHRVAHHAPTSDPLLLIDVHFLAAALDPAAWARFADEAEAGGLAAVCAFELDRARETWGTAVPASVRDRLRAVRGEPSAAHLRPLGPLYVQWQNFRRLRGRRLALLAQHLAPPPQYMRARFGPAAPPRLAWLYVRRAIGGATRWVRELARRAWQAE